MAGLLGDVLPYVYSRGNMLKRMMDDLASDPVGVAQNAAGQLRDSGAAQQNVLAQAFANPARPFQVTDRAALGQAAQNMLAGPLGFAPAGITAWHGTMTPGFEQFNLDHFGKTDGGWLGKGVYGSESPMDASAYAMVNGKPGGAVYKVDMDIKRPLVIDWEDKAKSEMLELRRNLGPEGFSDWLRKNGYDGVKFLGPKGALNGAGERDVQWMAVDPAQVSFSTPSRR